jgi:hypothetical protein
VKVLYLEFLNLPACESRLFESVKILDGWPNAKSLMAIQMQRNKMTNHGDKKEVPLEE